MPASTLRVTACAGALALGLLAGLVAAPVSFADTGDTGGVGTTDADDSSTPDDGDEDDGDGFSPSPKPDGTPGDGSPAGDGDRPTSTVGNGRNDVRNSGDDADESSDAGAGGQSAKPVRRYKSSILVPVLRIPTQAEFAAPGLTPPSAYIGTMEVGVPFLSDVLGAFSQPSPPAPQPTPGPAFRTQQEAPVIDASPGDSGVSEPMTRGGADTPPVFEAPLVIAPRMPIVANARVAAPIGGSAARAPAIPTGATPAVAGARTPLIRGSLPPSAPAASRPITPMSGQATRAGYPQYLRTPTVRELSYIALPGVAGLLLVTAGGGVIGYRQANSARFVRTTAAARFLP